MFLMVPRVRGRSAVGTAIGHGLGDLAEGIGEGVTLGSSSIASLVLCYEATYFTGIRFHSYPFRWDGTIRALVVYPT